MPEAFICDGMRTPIGRYAGGLARVRTDDLAAVPIKALMARNPKIDWERLDEVYYGCANQAGEDNRNVARMALLLAGLPVSVPGVTLNRLCASGMEAITTAASKIWANEAEIILVGGTESMSNIPLLFNRKMTNLFANLFKAKTIWQKLSAISKFRPNFLTPIIGIQQGLTDPVSGMIMGCTAEAVAKEFAITRK